MRKANRLPLDALAPYLLEVPDPPTFLSWPAVFGNDHAVEIEVGFGKGLFLLTASQACPGVNFLGIEIVRKYQLYAATRLAKRDIRNVRVVKADAREFFRDCIASESVQAVHLYFPDPWWKNRHHKRRVFTSDFAGNCERVLRPGGRLHVVTDVADYFALVQELMADRPGFQALPTPAAHEPVHDLDYLTNFERKFRKEERAIFRGMFEKKVISH